MISIFLISSLLLVQTPITGNVDTNTLYTQIVSPLNERIWSLQLQLLQTMDELKQTQAKVTQLEEEVKKLKGEESK